MTYFSCILNREQLKWSKEKPARRIQIKLVIIGQDFKSNPNPLWQKATVCLVIIIVFKSSIVLKFNLYLFFFSQDTHFSHFTYKWFMTFFIYLFFLFWRNFYFHWKVVFDKNISSIGHKKNKRTFMDIQNKNKHLSIYKIFYFTRIKLEFHTCQCKKLRTTKLFIIDQYK